MNITSTSLFTRLQTIARQEIPEPEIPETVKSLFSEETLNRVFPNREDEKQDFLKLTSHAIAQFNFSSSIKASIGINFPGLDQLITDESRANWIFNHLIRMQRMSEDLEACRGKRKYGAEYPNLPENIPEQILERIVADLEFLTQDPYKNFNEFKEGKMISTKHFIFGTLGRHLERNEAEAQEIFEWLYHTYLQSDKTLRSDLFSLGCFDLTS